MGLRIGKALYGGGFEIEGGGTMPFVLPGEVVEGEAVVEASASRRAAGCVHFGVCGGCQYQHAAYAEQVRLKVGILRDLIGFEEIEAVTGPEWGYRNRVRMRVEGGRVGYSRRGTNEFLPVVMCPIAAPGVWEVAEVLAGRVAEAVEEVEIFAAQSPLVERVEVELVLRDGLAAGEFARICEGLPGSVVGVGAVMGESAPRRKRVAFKDLAWGAGGMKYGVSGREYWVSRGAFFQVNRFLVDRLVELACGGLEGELAWDLYAGAGLFSKVLREAFERVVAVEGGAIAARDLTGVKGVEARREGAVEFLRRAVTERDRPEVVVLDPPRAGLGVEGAGLLVRVGSERVRYVSCDPVTLGRDLAVLREGGYGVERVVMVDLFPQTFHLETVVWLRKG